LNGQRVRYFRLCNQEVEGSIPFVSIRSFGSGSDSDRAEDWIWSGEVADGCEIAGTLAVDVDERPDLGGSSAHHNDPIGIASPMLWVAKRLVFGSAWPGRSGRGCLQRFVAVESSAIAANARAIREISGIEFDTQRQTIDIRFPPHLNRLSMCSQ
jgi:hypothetical protein